VKRVILILLLLLLLSGISVVAWTVAGLPPVRMVWSYGFSYHPKPTGKVVPYEDVKFVEIGPSCYRMGSNQGTEGGDSLGRWCSRFGLPWGDQPKPSNEMPVHWVEFPRGFWIAKHEVTNAQYEAFDPKHERSDSSPGDNDPVVRVFLEDARNYCEWLSKQSGHAVRLPSEAEWECACRAGSDAEFCFGDDEKRLGEYAWWAKNTRCIKAHEVGTLQPNAWGLHDFHGNVEEWCEDNWHENFEGAPTDGTAWMDEADSSCVIRGGSFILWSEDCRSAVRAQVPPGFRQSFVGFRPTISRSEE